MAKEEDVWNNNNKEEVDNEVEEENVQDERWTTVADGNEEPPLTDDARDVNANEEVRSSCL